MELAVVDKLIRERIYEIIIVIILVITTIPIWQGFNDKISKADIKTLDDYNLQFSITNKVKSDFISISNDYYINKSYKLYLKVNKEVNKDSSTITINHSEYNLEDFTKYENGGYYFYTLAAKNLSGAIDVYEIEPKLIGKGIAYTYIFEENNNF